MDNRRYEALMAFLLTELSEPTLRNIKAAADKRFNNIYKLVIANPEISTTALEGVLEDFLNRVGDYLSR